MGKYLCSNWKMYYLEKSRNPSYVSNLSADPFLCILLVRRRLQQIQLVKGPNRILLSLEDLTFINPQLSKKVSSVPESYRINPLSTIM